MKQKNALIVKKQTNQVDPLKPYIDDLDLVYHFLICTNIKELKILLTKVDVDLIILYLSHDQTENRSLIDFFSIQKSNPPILIIGQNDEQALFCFDLNGNVDYITKNSSEKKILTSLNKAIYSKNEIKLHTQEYIFFRVGKIVKKYSLSEISHIEAYGIFSKLFVNSKENLVSEQISKLENRLPNSTFIRIHKSFIINLNHCTAFDKKFAYIGDMKIPIGPKYKENISHILQLIDRL